jgi:PAS domain S-box-containing protein
MQPPSSHDPEPTDLGAFALDQIFVAAVLEHAPFHLYFKDRDCRFIAVGRQKWLRHGLADASEIIGKSDADCFSPEHAERARNDEEHIMRTGATLVGQEEQLVWPDGAVTWGRATKMPLREESGAIIGTFGYTEDITKQKELSLSLKEVQDALVDASRMAGMAEIATGVLHNVGNVLNSLNVSASILASGMRSSKAESLGKVGLLLSEHSADLATFLTEDPKGKKIPEFLDALSRHFASERERLLKEIEAMQKNVDHIKEIVSMQQAYATMGGMLESVDAASLMEDALRLNNGILVRNPVAVIKDYQPVPDLIAEKGKVLQILVNLIRNGKHACDETARPDRALTLRVTPGEPGRVHLIVQDNGIGIPAENLLKIFQHGFTTKTEGHGFGIHSSANAAREMKGSLSVYSDGPGQGTTFTLDLPAAEVVASPHPAALM